MDPREYRRVLGSYPTGVCLITAVDAQGQAAGMVVGSFTSVSLNPPLVGFFPDKKSSSWARIEKTQHFCVNVLGSDQNHICSAFTSKDGKKFEDIEYEMSGHALPLVKASLAYIECRLFSVTEAGDHWFVLGEVIRLEETREHSPMLFHKGGYGHFAIS